MSKNGSPNTPDLDWPELLSLHDEAPEEDFPGWREALEAMDTDAEQRALAIEADPLMLFRCHDETELDRQEIDDMKQAVANLRRTKAVEQTTELASSSGSWPAWRTAAGRVPRQIAGIAPFSARAGLVAALVAFCVTALMLSETRIDPGTVELAAATPTSIAGLSPATAELDAGLGWDAAATLPLVEDVGAATDVVMQYDDDTLTLVVVSQGSDDAIAMGNILASSSDEGV